MSDFTVDDTMAEIRYEVDDREIYNDVRSETMVTSSETIVDSTDTDYSWKWRGLRRKIPADSHVYSYLYNAWHPNPTEWKLSDTIYAYRYDGDHQVDYYEYAIRMEVASDLKSAIIYIENCGIFTMWIRTKVGYRYENTTVITHEEMVSTTYQVRAYDAASVQKYGRRVMNLTWSEGTEESAMQALVNYHLARYKDPIAKLRITLKGSTDALRTQIITREISDLITVVCTNLGLNADGFINSISITSDPHGMPLCRWELEIQRTYELLTLFVLDTSELDGAHILGS